MVGSAPRVGAAGRYQEEATMTTQLRRRMAMSALFRAFKPGTPGLGRRLAAIPRMVRATLRGEYDGGGRLAMMFMAGLYIVSPVDIAPEAFLFVLGLVDDAAVAAYFAGALLDETERFLTWERERSRVIPGNVTGRGYRVPGGRTHPGTVPGRPGADATRPRPGRR